MEENVNLAPYVIRFTWVFVLMSVAALIIIAAFQLSGNAGLGVGITFASAVSAGQKFLTDKRRVFVTSEKLRMATHSILITWMISLLLVATLLMISGDDIAALYRNLLSKIAPEIFAATAVFISLLSFAIFYLVYGVLTDLIFRGMEKRGEI